MTIDRRGFLSAMLAAAVAPAFVRPTSLMPLWVPAQTPIFWPTPEPLWGIVEDRILMQYQNFAGEFIDLLRPQTILGRFPGPGTVSQFDVRIRARDLRYEVL